MPSDERILGHVEEEDLVLRELLAKRGDPELCKYVKICGHILASGS